MESVTYEQVKGYTNNLIRVAKLYMSYMDVPYERISTIALNLSLVAPLVWECPDTLAKFFDEKEKENGTQN